MRSMAGSLHTSEHRRAKLAENAGGMRPPARASPARRHDARYGAAGCPWRPRATRAHAPRIQLAGRLDRRPAPAAWRLPIKTWADMLDKNSWSRYRGPRHLMYRTAEHADRHPDQGRRRICGRVQRLSRHGAGRVMGPAARSTTIKATLPGGSPEEVRGGRHLPRRLADFRPRHRDSSGRLPGRCSNRALRSPTAAPGLRRPAFRTSG